MSEHDLQAPYGISFIKKYLVRMKLGEIIPFPLWKDAKKDFFKTKYNSFLCKTNKLHNNNSIITSVIATYCV